jgi:hypothetical protein
VGVDGVNVHTNPPAPALASGAARQPHVIHSSQKSQALNSLFYFQRTAGRWHASVRPEYYGMLLFAQAAPAGSRLLKTSLSHRALGLHVWATREADRLTHVVLINENLRRPVVATIRIPGASGVGAIERLTAPRLQATSGTTLGGQGFGASTTTGILPPPIPLPAEPSDGAYRVRVPPTTAVMLTEAPAPLARPDLTCPCGGG